MKPCIRGLREFKKGCPESSQCSCWIEKAMSKIGGGTEIIKQCADLWIIQLLFDMCALMEGNQQATESSRNMIALQSLVSTESGNPIELVRVAAKVLKQSEEKLRLKHEST